MPAASKNSAFIATAFHLLHLIIRANGELVALLIAGLYSQAMNIAEQIIRAESTFPCGFSNAKQCPWGVMYHNVDIPDSHDSNHAWIFSGDPQQVISEIEDFYRDKGISPRVRRAFPAAQSDPFGKVLEDRLFSIEQDKNRFFLHRGASQIDATADLEIRSLKTPDADMLDMFEHSDSLRGRLVLESRKATADYHLLAGCIDGKIVVAASLESLGDVTRVDDVLTDIKHRGCGYARRLTQALVEYHYEHIGNQLYLYADNPTAIRIYIEAGFEEVDLATTWYQAAAE